MKKADWGLFFSGDRIVMVCPVEDGEPVYDALCQEVEEEGFRLGKVLEDTTDVYAYAYRDAYQWMQKYIASWPLTPEGKADLERGYEDGLEARKVEKGS